MLFFEELKRRNVFRVAIAYMVSAWFLIQIAETIFPLPGLKGRPHSGPAFFVFQGRAAFCETDQAAKTNSSEREVYVVSNGPNVVAIGHEYPCASVAHSTEFQNSLAEYELSSVHCLNNCQSIQRV